MILSFRVLYNSGAQRHKHAVILDTGTVLYLYNAHYFCNFPSTGSVACSNRNILLHNTDYHMDDLPLSRDDDGEIRLAGTTEPVSLQIVYDCILGTGGQGAVFVGKVLSKSDSRVLMQVSEIASFRV